MPNYELLYFEFRGRAEAARLVLNYAKVPFTDTRIPREEWPSLKGDKSRFPYGQLPVLLIDGKPLAQSHAILRYLAPECGVAGRSRLEAAEIDELYEVCRCFFDLIIPYLRVYLGFGAGDKEQLYKDVFLPALDKELPVIQELIGENGFFHPSGVTYTDFYFADSIEAFVRMHPADFEKFPKILEHIKRIHQLPELQEYLAKRPEHSF
ncbi:unnamed protein product [Bursaphelenchus xylophilus]|uniref:glutathione transferase n=1 Tax=Bursaphelenchus xylophilus TaxID=6326 RepID=A0A1I7RQK5_BURXY|nr:unnamed protein product [Bursaphelenchus xylophilus]CAG9104739.1 unnamed protein product [Bursaphelenchus xylophilus]